MISLSINSHLCVCIAALSCPVNNAVASQCFPWAVTFVVNTDDPILILPACILTIALDYGDDLWIAINKQATYVTHLHYTASKYRMLQVIVEKLFPLRPL